jgi:type II secretion system protein H
MKKQEQRGYTLVELVIVVSIIALIAAIAVPAVSPDSDKKLHLAAEKVASAVRFARSEAIRTGEGHGLTISQVTQQVTVDKYDITSAPISTLGTARHPVDKQPYDFNVNTTSITQGVTISNSSDAFDYGSEGRRKSLLFDPRGVPVWIVGSDPTRHLLEDGTIELSYGTRQRIVSVAPITGRVTVQ